MSEARVAAAVLPVEIRPLVSSAEEATSIPWTVWLIVVGITFKLFGGLWDLAWHMSIGIDVSLAPPPHMVVQGATGLLAIACAYSFLSSTLRSSASTDNESVRVLGLRGPAGAFIVAWACIATFISEPFDNWWHHAYGDVTILTPPHVLLAIGSHAAEIGAMAWIASIMNYSDEVLRRRLSLLFLLVGSTGLVTLAGFIPDVTSMHSADCYLAFALAIPTWLIGCGWGSGHKWGCTIAAGFYTGILLAAEWLLPLFPAQPKFGPVYHNVTHLIPAGFPPVLLVSAFVADLLLQRFGLRSSWFKALWVGPALVLGFLAVQWPFASFLMSPAARNWVFGTAYFAYSDPAGFLFDPYKFEEGTNLGAFLLRMAIALGASVVTARIGLAWAEWMRRVRR
jgi:hypothetical protein